ncbi:transposase [Gemmata sp. G18]|uniref:Transposase n=1 Tax=Gemmata palustris TaxID=2822762 RepID=A0ABS5BMF2_9BACT|nr:transposase [Gemmata palustris]MBP3954903.1 transposase [Gemmata palustris]
MRRTSYWRRSWVGCGASCGCTCAASGRQRYNVRGALNAVTHERVTEINTTYITARRCALLHTIARAGSVPVTLVLDNARYQRCVLVQDAAKQLGIELLFLPSYSPNLNLIERCGSS